jgi:hypothetical protein
MDDDAITSPGCFCAGGREEARIRSEAFLVGYRTHLRSVHACTLRLIAGWECAGDLPLSDTGPSFVLAWTAWLAIGELRSRLAGQTRAVAEILTRRQPLHLRFAKMAREVVERPASACRDSHRDKLRQMIG